MSAYSLLHDPFVFFEMNQWAVKERENISSGRTY